MSISKREFYVGIASVLLVTCVYGYAFTVTYLAPPVTEKVLYEVWDVQHPANDKITLTVVYTRGQGIYRFIGEHSFTVGGSYHIKYSEDPVNRLYYNLLYVTEVNLPG